MFRCLYFGFLYKQEADENELVCEVVSCRFLHYLLGNKPFGITCFEWRAGLTLCIVVKWKLADPRLVRIKKTTKTNKQTKTCECMLLTLSSFSGLELWPSPYSRAYCRHISASLLWRELTRPRSSFSLDWRAPACSPWLSVKFSTTAFTKICRIWWGKKQV